MAYAALVSLAQTIDLITSNRHDSVSPQVIDQLTSIHKHVISLQEFLEDFPDKPNSSTEARIKDAAHLAEDTIEFLLSDALLNHSKSKLKRQLRGRLEQIQSRYASLKSNVVSLSASKSKQAKAKDNDGIFRRHHFHELKKAGREIESASEAMMAIKNSTITHGGAGCSSGPSSSSSTVAPIRKDAMVGFDGELMAIKRRLCGEPASPLETIPIAGMGGIGKTTLAVNAYNDPLIMERFHIRAWVTVSQDYNVREITSGLLASMELAQGDSQQHHVFQKLKCRRFLIVLDDVWSTKAWDELRLMFPDDRNGSRIILTTRLVDVASYVVDVAGHIHFMRLLDEDQSWSLLKQKVFRQGFCPDDKLAYAGKMIARSCRGLPLAIVVISGLLALDQTKSGWNNVARNVNSVISENDEQFDKILSLSYAHLPHHLKPCFLYMAGFPEYYDMRASKLFKLWVAEGFLKAKRYKSLEETAEEYLEDLVKRSLVLVTQRKSNGRIKSLSIHDLLREMCIRKAREQDFLLQLRGLKYASSLKIPRRLSVIHSDLDSLQGCTIRTIICLEERRRGRGRQCSVRCFRLLRILDLMNAYEYFYDYKNDNSPVFSLPEELFELFHLRYLAFDYTFTIPGAISNLQNLQTLIIGPRKYRGYFVPLAVEVWRMPQQLPPEIWDMPQLRHLVFCSGLRLFQRGATAALENLLTLSLAINFSCSAEILQKIPNLKKLGLYYTRGEYLHTEIRNEEQSHVYSIMYVEQLKNIGCLRFLENLKLKMHHSLPYPGELTLRALPLSLRKLTLSGLKLPWKHMKIVGSLPWLEVVKLRDFACNGVEWETSEGGFCELRYLLISGSNLRDWVTESSHFPRLKRLVLLRCPNLRGIPEEIGEIATLQVIEMDNWNTDLVESARQIQDDQESCGNDAVHLRFV
ncbi:putative late blight resistance protein homolog R1B-12 [Salvia miltiorrhiza]|uniref:putative late blight resistance protein homolog R1B-12 n=1 Tax=Salvia miltiorrhiza TaxID=226208 RepID=UPI0025AC2861|nr:putative late blight resistance protein homolog R1B-12 [Salvia miltiorrhiza]